MVIREGFKFMNIIKNKTFELKIKRDGNRNNLDGG